MVDVVCYCVRSLFTEIPILVNCPYCHQELAKRAVEPTKNGLIFQHYATIPLIETAFYRCKQCGWWAVREVCVDYEFDDACSDYLVVPEAPMPTNKRSKMRISKEPPWKQISENPKVWSNHRIMTVEEARFYFGENQVSRKSRNSTA